MDRVFVVGDIYFLGDFVVKEYLIFIYIVNFDLIYMYICKGNFGIYINLNFNYFLLILVMFLIKF